MNISPRDEDLVPFVINRVDPLNPAVRKVRKAWTKIVWSGPELGKKNVIANKPYVKWAKGRAQIVKIPFYFESSYLPQAPEPEPILQEDVGKLTSKINELELENTVLQLQLIKEKQRGDELEDEEGKEVKTLYESSKKRTREKKGKKEWVGGALLEANSELSSHNDELDRACRVVRELERTLELTNMDKKSAREDYEAHISEMRKNIKEYQDHASREKLEKEKIHRACLHEQFQLGKAHEQIQSMKAGIIDVAYQELRNNCLYWEDSYRKTEGAIAERDTIIRNLQGIYT